MFQLYVPHITGKADRITTLIQELSTKNLQWHSITCN